MLKAVVNSPIRSGDQTINNGNLIVGTAGKGVDFSANTHSAGMTSELFAWYEEGTWTPTITFQTPGDLSVSYSSRVGTYTRIGNRVILQGYIVLSSFTYTTASGYLRLTGIPFNGTTSSNCQNYGSLAFRGITKANYTDFVVSIEPILPDSIIVYCSGSGQATDFVAASNMPSGGAVELKFTMTYQV